MDSYQPAIFAYWGSKVSSKLHAFHFHLTIPNQLVCMYGSIIPGLQVDKLPAFHYMAHQWDLWYKRRTVHLDPRDQHFFWVCEFLVKLQTWLFQCTCSDSQVPWMALFWWVFLIKYGRGTTLSILFQQVGLSMKWIDISLQTTSNNYSRPWCKPKELERNPPKPSNPTLAPSSFPGP